MGGRLGCTAEAHGQDGGEPGRDGLGGGSPGGRCRERIRPGVGWWTDRSPRPWRGCRVRGAPRGAASAHRDCGHDCRRAPALATTVRRTAPGRHTPVPLPRRPHGRWVAARRNRRCAQLRHLARWLLRSSTAWLPSAGIEQVPRTRSRSWPITLVPTGPARPRRGGVGCRCGSGYPSGRPGDLPRCCWGVVAGPVSSSSSSGMVRRSLPIRLCGAPCGRPPRVGPRARARGWRAWDAQLEGIA